MTTKPSPATLSLVRWTFDTPAAAKTDMRLAVGDVIETRGRVTVGDLGGWFYTVKPAETAVDGYVDHRLDNGLALVLDHGSVFHAEWAGAVQGIEVSAQMNAAFAHIRDWKAANGNPDIEFVHSSTCTLANQVVLATAGGARLTGVNVDFSNSSLSAAPGGNLSATVAMLLVKIRGDGQWGQLYGAKFAAGYDFTACAGSRFYNPAAVHFKGFGVKVDGAAGSMVISYMLLNEYDPADVEFNGQENFTARGLDARTGDWICVAANVKWCLDPLYVGPEAVGIHFIDCHWVNGNPNYDAGSEPIVILGMGQSNMVGNASSTTGSHTIASGVYVWNGDFDTHGTAFIPAAFGTAPFNVGADPWANNLMIHAANSLKAATGRDVYIIMVADGGRKIECFLTPEMLAANGWTSAVNFTPFMYPDIVAACEAVPDRVSPFPDLILWQQGEANSGDTMAAYRSKLHALIDDLSAHGVLYGGNTKMTIGGLVPVNAFYADHKTACESAAGSYSYVKYIQTTGLADTDGLHFTGAALVTLGTAHAEAFAFPSAAAGGPPFINPSLVNNNALRVNHFHGNYFDNGISHDKQGTMAIRHGHVVKNNRAAITGPNIRVYATQVDQVAAPGFSVMNLGGRCTVGFVDTDDFNWAGDWSFVEDKYPSMDNDNTVTNAARTVHNMFSGNLTAASVWNARSQGNFRIEWASEGFNLTEIYNPATGTKELVGKFKAQTLNLSALPTSATGLVSGDVWNDAGTLKVVA